MRKPISESFESSVQFFKNAYSFMCVPMCILMNYSMPFFECLTLQGLNCHSFYYIAEGEGISDSDAE